MGVEVNISCPNVANRGLVFACDPVSSDRVVRLVRERLPSGTPIFAKLTPDVTDIVAIAQAALKAGALAGFGFVATSFGINYQFAQRSYKLWLIDAGYHTLQFVLFGLILGLWH